MFTDLQHSRDWVSSSTPPCRLASSDPLVPPGDASADFRCGCPLSWIRSDFSRPGAFHRDGGNIARPRRIWSLFHRHASFRPLGVISARSRPPRARSRISGVPKVAGPTGGGASRPGTDDQQRSSATSVSVDCGVRPGSYGWSSTCRYGAYSWAWQHSTSRRSSNRIWRFFRLVFRSSL